MLRRSLLWASRNRWLADHLPRYRFAQLAARRFMPGEDLDAALGAAADLAKSGITTILSRLGENVTTLETAAGVRDHYRMVLDRIAAGGVPAQVSLKLTHLGLDLSQPHAAACLEQLAAHAAASGSAVWVDMEGSAYTERTLEVFAHVLARHRNVGVCLQAYLLRTDRDLETLAPRTSAIRLVKGAYNEPASIALTKKRDIDDTFHRLALRMLEIDRDRTTIDAPALRPALGTHDTTLLSRIAADASARGIPADRYEVQMLYGIRVPDQRRIAAEGTPVRTLISYGPEWFPWFVRRLAERPANLTILARNLIPV